MTVAEPMLFCLRVRYVKQGRLRHLGHLEVARTVERSVRRAGLPYAVTQGFSPHMRIAFSSALPVATSSVCEWYDLVLKSYVPAAEALEKLTAATPKDLAPVQAGYIDMRAPTLGLLITRQDYRIYLATSYAAEEVDGALGVVAALGKVNYLRGKKEKVLDLTATLDTWSVEPADGGVSITLNTRSSNEGSLRPEILLTAIDRVLTDTLKTEPITSTGTPELACFSRIEVERQDQYGEDDEGGRIDPL